MKKQYIHVEETFCSGNKEIKENSRIEINNTNDGYFFQWDGKEFKIIPGEILFIRSEYQNGDFSQRVFQLKTENE